MTGLKTGRTVGRYDVLILTALLWFMAKFLRYAFPPLFETFQETFLVSNTMLGAAYTAFMLIYALMQFPSGLLADRIGSVIVIVSGGLLASLAAVLIGIEGSFAMLVVAMVLMGAGTGVHKTVSVRLLSQSYPSRTGRALGVLDTVGAFGGVIAPIAVVIALAAPVVLSTGWRGLFVVSGLVGLFLTWSFARRVPKRLDGGDGLSSGAERTASLDLRRYLSLFRDWRFSVFVMITITFAFVYNGFVAFIPLYLIQEAGLEASFANLLFSLLFVVSLVQLLTGELSDRVGTLPVIAFSIAIATVGLIGLIIVTPVGQPILISLAIVAIGIGAHGYRPVRSAYLMAVIPDRLAGGSLGVVRTFLMGAGAVSPVIVGFLSEVIGFRVAFIAMAVILVLASLLTAVLLASPPPEIRRDRPTGTQ